MTPKSAPCRLGGIWCKAALPCGRQQVFGVSKSTVWKDQCRLQHLAPGLWQEVRAVLLYNKAQRHLRGGEATRCKYLHAQHNHAD